MWDAPNSPAFQDDEGTYTAQAMAVTHGRLAPYTYWYDHPPLGWIQLGALAWIPRMLISGGGTDIGNMRYVMSLFFVASSVLIFIIARRLQVRILFAVLAVALFCLSPLSLTLARQVYLDNVATPWLLLAFYLALSPRLALWQHIGAGVCFAAAVLSKETVAVFGPALLIAMVHRSSWRTRAFSILGFLTAGTLILSFYPLLATLRGELVTGTGHVSLEDALRYQFLARPGSGVLWEPGSGRQQVVSGWMYYDKYLIVVGLAAAGICLFRQRHRWIPVGLVVFALPMVLGSGYLPTMYVIAAVPFLVLAIGAGADLLWDLVEHVGGNYSWRRKAVSVVAAAAVVGGMLTMSIPQWLEKDTTLLTSQANSDWYQTLVWIRNNVPKNKTVLVPYSMWQDLDSSGWNSPWQMIVLEKMDLDPGYVAHHPNGWRDVQWIIEGPSVKSNISFLNLTEAGKALDNSQIVKSFGEWNIRKVIAGSAQLREKETAGVRP